MKITVDGVTVLDREFASTEALLAELRDAEFENGRELPRFSWEALALMAAGWLLGKGADKAFDWLVEYRGKAKERREAEAASAEAAKRHAQLMAKLDQLAIADGRHVPGDYAWLKEAVSSGRVRIEVVLETPAEIDLQPAFRELIPERNVRFLRPPDEGEE